MSTSSATLRRVKTKCYSPSVCIKALEGHFINFSDFNNINYHTTNGLISVLEANKSYFQKPAITREYWLIKLTVIVLLTICLSLQLQYLIIFIVCFFGIICNRRS